MYTDPSGHFRELSKYALDGMVIRNTSAQYATPAQKKEQAKDIAKTLSRQPTTTRAPAVKPTPTPTPATAVKPPPAVTPTPTPTPVATATPAATVTPSINDDSGISLEWPVPAHPFEAKDYKEGEVRRFGMRAQHPVYGTRMMHNGIDIGPHVREGMDVVAAAGGYIVKSVDHIVDNPIGEPNKKEPNGNYIFMKHVDSKGNPYFTKYLHLQQNSLVKFEEGQYIPAGTKIALLGNSGASTDPHLHFELHVFGKPVDPIPYFNFSK